MSIDAGPRLPRAFDAGLAGQFCRLDRSGAPPIALPVRRWRADANRSDRWLLRACQGPTVDLGCGPGRLVAALAERGVPALGVDSSDVAIRLCRARGAVALRRDVFEPLPGEGRWHHALLADGNIGIGGDPVALLHRVRGLLSRRGSVLVELTRRSGLWRGPARLVASDGSDSGWFPWAQVGLDALPAVAASAGLSVRRSRAGRRPYAELTPTA
ncbi:class I SAM-dependent methyltransferase [Pseudonocardia spinosispora]|uniref:class I SAM-dependent methyltransferase n=1 Tax=Pseudonocardia spinosispora TaxID=103441 RepID=UPI000411E15A|nr:class I SAM-dependent methyltransferase [Pseudonocardia spinosispora]